MSMLYKMDVTNAAGTLLTLELADISDGLLLADVQGLDPVKATLVSSSFAKLDGEQFHAARREARNIILKIELHPDFVNTSSAGLRSQLYNFFMSKTSVVFKFYMDDGLTVTISGVVETCESDMFTKKAVVDISVMCFNPDLVDIVTQSISGSTVSTTTETALTYNGTVETGIVFTLDVDRTLTEFTIYHRAPDGTLRQLDFSYPLVAGDTVVISTIPGAKGATLTRSGTASSVLNGVPPQSTWISLSKGANTIRVFATGAAIPFTLAYMNKYGGL